MLPPSPTPTGTSPIPTPPGDRPTYRAAAVQAFAWTLLIGLAALVNFKTHEFTAVEHARSVASAYIDKDLAVRRWVAEHGGVYVPPSTKTPPNPYLTAPDRDVTTTGGKALTLVNPAYATRQLQEDFQASHGIRSHLTGLVLKNPGNAPVPWERHALEDMVQGAQGFWELADEAEGEVLRMMRPVLMEPGCMKCHADLNIPVGGLRGGISTVIPMAPYRAEHGRGTLRAALSHLGIWAVGLAAIGVFTRRRRDQDRERNRVLVVAQRDDRRIAEILSLSERLESLAERDLIQEGLEAAVRLTDSQIGFFHFVNEDENTIELVTWSKETLRSFCHAAYDAHYPLERAGVWADCARLHQPVVHNDYPNLAVKRGLPEGHAALARLMSVPVIEGGRVRVITGVGNKVALYDDADVRMLQLLANDVWKLVQRKRADSEVRASERRLTEAQAIANMGSWSLDYGTRAAKWSDQMHAIFGTERLSFQPAVESVTALIHPEDREALAEALKRSLEDRRPFDHIARVTRPDGGLRVVHFRAVTEFDPSGKATSSLGTAHDVTEAHEVERLRRNAADLTKLIERTDRLFWLIDTDSRLVVGNAAFQHWMESTIGRVLTAGTPLPPQGMPAAEAERWRTYYQRALAGEQFSVEHELPHAPGEPGRWLSVSLYPVIDDATGHVSGINVSARDITEQHRLQAAQHATLAELEHMVTRLEGHHHRSQQCQRLSDLLQSCRTEREACDVVALVVRSLLPDAPGALALVGVGGRDLTVEARWGERAGDGMADVFGVDDCWSLRRGEPHAQGPGELPCSHFRVVPRHGALCQALVVRGETLGVLTIEYPPDLSPAGVSELGDTARTLAGIIKLGLSNLRLRVALEDQAVHDPLTGLYNRRSLDSALPRELHRAERARARVAVAMLDIDHFKRFNDTYGHEAGDVVLRAAGRLLSGRIRKSDTACRYGGEELLLILPDADLESARDRVASLVAEIRALSLEHQGRPLPTITVSAGIACTDEAGFDPAQLIRCADDALYVAKTRGRDRVEVWSTRTPPPH